MPHASRARQPKRLCIEGSDRVEVRPRRCGVFLRGGPFHDQRGDPIRVRLSPAPIVIAMLLPVGGSPLGAVSMALGLVLQIPRRVGAWMLTTPFSQVPQLLFSAWQGFRFCARPTPRLATWIEVRDGLRRVATATKSSQDRWISQSLSAYQYARVVAHSFLGPQLQIGQFLVFHLASKCRSIIRRTSSATEIPSFAASFTSAFRWGSVNEIICFTIPTSIPRVSHVG